MKYIVSLNRFAHEPEIAAIRDLPAAILYASDVIPILIIETSRDAAGRLSEFSFVEEYHEDRTGHVQTISQFGKYQNELHTIPGLGHSQLHENGYTGTGVKIFILDSGIEAYSEQPHEYKDFCPTEVYLKDSSHGALVYKVTRTIAPNGVFYVGRIGNGRGVMESSAIMGLEWAYKNGAQVVNASWGFVFSNCGRLWLCPICKLCDILTKSGAVIVAAAGNTTEDNDFINLCPGKNARCITVGSVDPTGVKKADHSCVGSDALQKPDILAPGHVSYRGRAEHGTSFATPCVSGILADVLSTGVSLQDAVNMVFSSVVDLRIPYIEQGRGKVDVTTLVSKIRRISNENASARDQ